MSSFLKGSWHGNALFNFIFAINRKQEASALVSSNEAFKYLQVVTIAHIEADQELLVCILCSPIRT